MMNDEPTTTSDDQELETLLRGLRTDLPFLGESLVMGHIYTFIGVLYSSSTSKGSN